MPLAAAKDSQTRGGTQQGAVLHTCYSVFNITNHVAVLLSLYPHHLRLRVIGRILEDAVRAKSRGGHCIRAVNTDSGCACSKY
jgi:hypothetical protein